MSMGVIMEEIERVIITSLRAHTINVMKKVSNHTRIHFWKEMKCYITNWLVALVLVLKSKNFIFNFEISLLKAS